MNLLEFLHAGGFVMWPLAALSLACLAVVTERIHAFWRAPSPAHLIARARSSTNANGLETEIQSAASNHLLELERNLPLLSGVAALAPLLGLWER
jgi:biopolymer transport protein ExbB/TolQ